MEQGSGVGFELRHRAFPHEGADEAHKPELFENGDGELRRLVRADAERNPGCGEPLERRLDASVRPCQLRRGTRIVLPEPGERAIEIVRRAAGRIEAPRDQCRHAVADETGDTLKRQGRPPKVAEHPVRRSMEIRRTVDQRAVKVENDRFHLLVPDEVGGWVLKLDFSSSPETSTSSKSIVTRSGAVGRNTLSA